MKMKKKISLFTILLFAFAALFAAAAFAAEVVESGNCGKNGDNVTYTLDSDGLLTISGKGDMEDYSVYGEMPPWYQNNRGLIKTIIIKSGVTSISSYAFQECESAKTVTIPDTVLKIGEYAFRDCKSIIEVIIPDSVQTIGKYAFAECVNVENLDI